MYRVYIKNRSIYLNIYKIYEKKIKMIYIAS